MKSKFKILAVIIVFCFIGFKILEYKFYLDSVPDEFGVYKILYSKERTARFGLGGNESGIRVYELPKETLEKIQKQGMEYFKNLPSNENAKIRRDWRGHFQNWSETPVEVIKEWTNYMSLEEDADYSKEIPSIDNYVNTYGFGVDIDPEIKKLVDDAIASSGSYYAYGRIGMIIIVPEARKVIYAYYNG